MSEFAVQAPWDHGLWLICDDAAPLKQNCQVVVTMDGDVVMIGYVHNRFPNLPRRLDIAYRGSDGRMHVSCIFGRLKEDANDTTRVGRVIGGCWQRPITGEAKTNPQSSASAGISPHRPIAARPPR